MGSEVKVGFQIKDKDRANLTLIAVNLSSIFLLNQDTFYSMTSVVSEFFIIL